LKKIHFLIAVSSFLLITTISGCTAANEISVIEAENISLEDAPKFKPQNRNFSIYHTEESSRGWVIQISSNEPNSEELFPNIWYVISRSGKIVERENMALGE
jgi:uncharacterized protein YcfL